MREPSIITNLIDKFDGDTEITLEKLKSSLSEKDFFVLKMYIRIYTQTTFKIFKNEIDDGLINRLMILRRELFFDDPSDVFEYDELIEYFECVEDYDSCKLLKDKKDEYYKN